MAQRRGEGHAGLVLVDVAGRQAHGGAVQRVEDAGARRHALEVDRLEVASDQSGHARRDTARIEIDIRIGRGHEQGAAGLPGRNQDVAQAGHDRHVGLARMAQRGGESHAGSVLIDVAHAQGNRGLVYRVGDLRRGLRRAIVDPLEVAAHQPVDADGQAIRIAIDIGVGGVDKQGAAGLARRDEDLAQVGHDLHVGLARLAQRDGESHAGGVLVDIAGADADRRGVDRVIDRGLGACRTEIDQFEIAAHEPVHAGRDAARVKVDIGVGRADEQRAAGLPRRDQDIAQAGHHRHVGLTRMAQRRGEGHASLVLVDIASSQRHQRRIQGVDDLGRGILVRHQHAVEAAALDRVDPGRESLGVDIGIVALHRHQHRAAVGAGRNIDDGAVAQGDGHVAAGRPIQHSPVADARPALLDLAIGIKPQQRQLWLGLRDGTELDVLDLAWLAKLVVVLQRRDALGDAQQPHEAAAVAATATGQSGRRSLDVIQVVAALERLDHRLHCARGSGLGWQQDVRPQFQDLIGSQRDPPAVVEQQFDLGTSRRPDRVAGTQLVTHRQHARSPRLIEHQDRSPQGHHACIQSHTFPLKSCRGPADQARARLPTRPARQSLCTK